MIKGNINFHYSKFSRVGCRYAVMDFNAQVYLMFNLRFFLQNVAQDTFLNAIVCFSMIGTC